MSWQSNITGDAMKFLVFPTGSDAYTSKKFSAMPRSSKGRLNVSGKKRLGGDRLGPAPAAGRGGQKGCLPAGEGGSNPPASTSVRKLYGGGALGVDVGGRPRWPANGTGFDSRHLHWSRLIPGSSFLGAQGEIRGTPLRPLVILVNLRSTGGEAPRRATFTGLYDRGPGTGTGSNPVASPRSGRASREFRETRRRGAFSLPPFFLVLSSYAHR